MAEYDGVVYSDYNKKYRFRVNYHVSQNIESAVSTITMSLTVETTDKNRQYNNYGTSYWNMTGTGDNYIKYDIAESQTELYLGSSSIQIQHDAIENGGFTLNAYWYTGRKSSSYIPEAMSMSTYITLQNIPRQSSISMSTANIEEQATITITSASTAFTHSVYAYFGSLHEVIATNQKGGTFNWTIPASFYTQIPDNVTGVGTIYCETYSNGTYIGVKTAGFRVTTNIDRCRPTVTGTVVDTNATTIALTGNANKLISGKSTAKITVTPTVKNSATLKSVTIDGVATTNNTRTIANVTKSSFPVVVTDSREYPNNTYSAVASAGIVNYVPLTLNAKFFRPQPTTGEIQLTYSGNYFNGSFGATSNSMGIEWHYRVKGSNTWIKGGTITPTISGNTIVEKTISLGTDYDYQTAYEFYIYAQDKLTSTSSTVSVPIGLPVFNWNKDFLNVNGDIRRWGISTHLLYPQALPPDNAASIDSVNGGGALQRTRICSFYDDHNDWYNLINIRHYNGEGNDGEKYGMQIRKLMADLSSPIETRSESGGVWTNWEQIPRYRILFDNSTGIRGTVSLIESSANFAYLEIYYALNGHIIKSIKVLSPNNNRFVLDGCWSAPELGLIQVETKTYLISDTSITPQTASWYANLVLTGIGSFGTQDTLTIYKVVGYR